MSSNASVLLAHRSITFKHELVKELHINDSHLDQIEHLLAQSMNGLHLLFDHQRVAEILKTPTEESTLFHDDNLEKIQGLFATFVQRESFHEKLEYLESLDKNSFELLLRTYFHIVDNSLYAEESNRH